MKKVKIEIFGTGCVKCHKTQEEIEKVVKALGISADIENVSDIVTIVDRGVMFTPAVFVDGEKKIEGKVPKPAEIQEWLKS